MFPHSTNQSNQILQGLSPCLILAISKRPCPGISSAVIQQNIRLEILFTATNTFTKRHVFTSVTFYVCFEYIVYFSRSPVFCVLFAPLLGRCSLADSTANHHSDVTMFCQFFDVPAVFEDSSWLCVCAPCQRTLCSNMVSGLRSNVSCLPMLNVSCLSESCFVSCDFDLFIDLLFGYSCIELFVKDNADLHVGVSVLLHVRFKVKNAFWCIELFNQIWLFVKIWISG